MIFRIGTTFPPKFLNRWAARSRLLNWKLILDLAIIAAAVLSTLAVFAAYVGWG